MKGLQLVVGLIKYIPVIVGSISSVEAMFKSLKGKSSEKKEAFISGAVAALGVTEAALNKDLLTDAETKELENLLGNVGDSVIAFHNFVAKVKARQSGEDN